jgi:hypothetical protein
LAEQKIDRIECALRQDVAGGPFTRWLLSLVLPVLTVGVAASVCERAA